MQPARGRPPRVQARIFPKEFPRSVETAPKLTGSGTADSGAGEECDGMEHNGSRAIRQNRVRELRENRLMTQAQLARKAKVALRTIHSVEKGMNCRMDTKRKILLALGLRFEDKDQVFPSVSASHALTQLPHSHS
jgi:DNA-binding XRE family transcriptional regulator